jgi:6-phosphogluconolactonase
MWKASPVSRATRQCSPNTKRTIIGVLFAFAAVAAAWAVAPGAAVSAAAQTAFGGTYLVYIGTYTSDGDPAKDTGSKGIYAYRFDTSSGEITDLGVVATSDQPSFIAVDPADKYLFAANESQTYQGQPSGGVSAFSIDKASGKLTILNEVASRGAAPAHITTDRTGKYVLVSNFNGGNLAVFPVGADGHLGEASDFVQHHGSSANPSLQAAPHVHQTVMSPDNHFAVSADLGLDKLFVYPFDSASGKLGAQPRVINITSGFGPRHVAFSPDGHYVYLISELASVVTELPYDPSSGAMDVRQTLRLAPAGDTAGQKSGAEIVVSPSGKFVYASNRFDNLIGIFSVDRDTGNLTRTETVPLDGKTPRNFAIDPGGQWLWEANQDSDNVILYRIDQKNGGLMPSGLTLKVPAPTCVLFVPVS